jgi:hypothetical protein
MARIIILWAALHDVAVGNHTSDFAGARAGPGAGQPPLRELRSVRVASSFKGSQV